METKTYTLENFTQETGTRFRMTKKQTARVELTRRTTPEDRQRIASMSLEEAADFFKAKNTKGEPLGWIEDAITLAQVWEDSMSLDREGAFQEFLASGGPQRVATKKPAVPVSVWLDPELTLDNFEEKALAATGHKLRFRIRKNQTARGLSREEALAEVIEEVRNKINEEVN